jgi:hypothetical protein
MANTVGVIIIFLLLCVFLPFSILYLAITGISNKAKREKKIDQLLDKKIDK